MRPTPSSRNALNPALATELTGAIQGATGSTSGIEKITEVGGGSISRAFQLRAANTDWFLKLNSGERHEMFTAEADGLEALGRSSAIRVPRVIAHGTTGPSAYLLLEYIELHPLRDGDSIRAAGHALADLHRIEGRRFGWLRDNFIGSTPQCNTAESDWPRFFANRRLAPQIDLARKQGYKGRVIADGERLVEKLPALFVGYLPKASLLHGDLWSGNAALDDSGRLVLFDPAVHFGDRESDLAMMALFGGFPTRMHAAYHEAWPLETGFEQRRLLYQLYHVLNHMNLFGGGYQAQAERMIGVLLAAMG